MAESGGVRIEELRGWQLCQIVCAPGAEEALASVMQMAGPGALPRTGDAVSVRDGVKLYALAPRTWWCLAPCGFLLADLMRTLDPCVATVTGLSAARVRIALEGPEARAVLEKGIAVDLHPRVFPVGCAVFTGLDHVGVMLERVAQDRWELFVPTTWAASVREWLLDAALPVSYDSDSGGDHP